MATTLKPFCKYNLITTRAFKQNKLPNVKFVKFLIINCHAATLRGTKLIRVYVLLNNIEVISD